MTGLLELAGIRPRDRAHHLACLLSVSHRPVTLMFRDTFGVALHPEPVRSGERGLEPGEAAELAARELTGCRWRTARLVTADGRLAASAFLLWLPGRIAAMSAQACAELDAGGEAAGALLSRLLPGGVVREACRALAYPRLDEITGQMSAIQSRAVLVSRSGPVVLAEENWMRGFAESLD